MIALNIGYIWKPLPAQKQKGQAAAAPPGKGPLRLPLGSCAVALASLNLIQAARAESVKSSETG